MDVSWCGLESLVFWLSFVLSPYFLCSGKSFSGIAGGGFALCCASNKLNLCQSCRFPYQKFRELRRLKEEEEGASDSTGDNKEEETQEQEDQTKPKTSSLLEELELYKQKARELEFKVEEVSSSCPNFNGKKKIKNFVNVRNDINIFSYQSCF